jgi:cytidine deaminase
VGYPASRNDLIAAAIEARKSAYAPYSGYSVGAAVLDELGEVWTGCNVENRSYGLSICAERTAVFRMVLEGGRQVRALALATSDGSGPCGACLQVLLEFAPKPGELEVHCVDENGAASEHTLAELLPFGFDSLELRRTEHEPEAV